MAFLLYPLWLFWVTGNISREYRQAYMSCPILHSPVIIHFYSSEIESYLQSLEIIGNKAQTNFYLI